MFILSLLLTISKVCQGQYILEYMHNINITQGYKNIDFVCGYDQIHKFSLFIQDNLGKTLEILYQNNSVQTQSYFKFHEKCVQNITIKCFEVYCELQFNQKIIIKNELTYQQNSFQNEYYKYHFLEILEMSVLVIEQFSQTIPHCSIKMYRSTKQYFDIFDYSYEANISKFGEIFSILEPGNHTILIKGCPQQKYLFILGDGYINTVHVYFTFFPEIKYIKLFELQYINRDGKKFKIDLYQGSIQIRYQDKLIDTDFKNTYYIYDIDEYNVGFYVKEKQTLIRYSEIQQQPLFLDIIVLIYQANFSEQIYYKNYIKSINFSGNCNQQTDDIIQNLYNTHSFNLVRRTEVNSVCELKLQINEVIIEFNSFVTKIVQTSNTSSVSVSINSALYSENLLLQINDIAGDTYFKNNQEKKIEIMSLQNIEINQTHLFSEFTLTLTIQNPIKYELISIYQMIVRNNTQNYFKIECFTLTPKFEKYILSQNNDLKIEFYRDNNFKQEVVLQSQSESNELFLKAISIKNPQSFIFTPNLIQYPDKIQVLMTDVITIFQTLYQESVHLNLLIYSLRSYLYIIHYYTSNQYMFTDDISQRQFSINRSNETQFEVFLNISEPSWIIMILEQDFGQIQLFSDEYQSLKEGFYYYYINQSQLLIASTCLNMNIYLNLIPLTQEFNEIIKENMYPSEQLYNLHYLIENQNLIYMDLQQYKCQYYVCLLRIRNQNQCFNVSINFSQKFILKPQQLYISQLQSQFNLLIEQPLHQFEAQKYMCIIQTLFGKINNVNGSDIQNLIFNYYGATFIVGNNQLFSIECCLQCIIQIDCHQTDVPMLLQTGYVYFFQLQNQSIMIENNNYSNYQYDLIVGEINIIQNSSNIIIKSESLSLFNFYFEHIEIMINSNIKLSIFQNIEISVVGPQKTIFIETESLSQLIDQNKTLEINEYFEYNFSSNISQSLLLQTNSAKISLNPFVLRMNLINEIHLYNDKQKVELIGLIRNEYYLINSNKDFEIFDNKNELILPLQSIYNGKYIKEYQFSLDSSYILPNISNDIFQILLFSNQNIYLLQNTTITTLNTNNRYYFQKDQHQYGIIVIQSEKEFNLLFDELVLLVRYFHTTFNQSRVKRFITETMPESSNNAISVYTYYLKNIEKYENCFKQENYQIEYIKQINKLEILIQISSLSTCQISKMAIIIKFNDKIQQNQLQKSNQIYSCTLQNPNNSFDFILLVTLSVDNIIINLQFYNHYQAVKQIDSHNYTSLYIIFLAAFLLILLLIQKQYFQKQSQKLWFTQQVDDNEQEMKEIIDDKETK